METRPRARRAALRGLDARTFRTFGRSGRDLSRNDEFNLRGDDAGLFPRSSDHRAPDRRICEIRNRGDRYRARTTVRVAGLGYRYCRIFVARSRCGTDSYGIAEGERVVVAEPDSWRRRLANQES